jgi:TonB family protein
MTLPLELALRTSPLIAAGLLLAAACARQSAAVRHLVLAAAVTGALLVVPLGLILPAWDVPERSAAGVDASPAGGSVTHIGGGVVSGQQTAAPVVPYRLLWAAGATVSALVVLAGFVRLRLLTRGGPPPDERSTRVCADVCGAYGIRRPVSLVCGNASGLVATWGVWRPRVLLPADAQHWDDNRLRVVLAHELAHIRRNDWMVQMTAEALRALVWFSPLVWLACARLRREGEQASDDAVLGLGVPAGEYASHLLELARGHGRSPAWTAALLMARPSTLERRIAAMLTPRLNRSARSSRDVAVTALTMLALTLPVAGFRAAQRTPTPLYGSVFDATGAALPEVRLTVRDARQLELQTTTDAAGRFAFPALGPGDYVLEATLPGFRALRQDVALARERDWHRIITLQVGAVRETISVSASRLAQRPRQGAGATPIRVGGNVRPPTKVKDVRPIYPESMREAGIEGVVPIEAVIARDGTVQSVRVLSAGVHPELAQAAVDAVRQWRFTATLLNGTPVDITMTTTVEFTLSD